MDVIAYIYEADLHCTYCAAQQFGDTLDDDNTRDKYGDTIGAAFFAEDILDLSNPELIPVAECATCREIFLDRRNVPGWRPSDLWPADDIDALIRDARELGDEEGKAAASWVIDGNTDEGAVRDLHRGFTDGDPEIYNAVASVLMPRRDDPSSPDNSVGYELTGLPMADLDSDLDDRLLEVYEEGVADAFVPECERIVYNYVQAREEDTL